MIYTVYFDLHCDTPYECFMRRCTIYDRSLAVNGFDMSVFSEYKQIFAVWIKDGTPNPYRLYKDILSDFKSKLCSAPKNLTARFSVEGGAVLEDEPERIFELKKDGVCLLTLTWNGQNRIASGIHCDGGITDYGREVISFMNTANTVCDLAHINRRGFYEALEIAEKVAVTHACADAVNPNPRNLTDEQIKAVSQRGGIIGLCLYPAFLGGDGAFDAALRHISHMLELGAEDCIAIGSDFDGAVMSNEISNISNIPALYRYLSENGLNGEILDKIFYKNADNFFANL